MNEFNVRRRVFGLAPGVPSLNPHRSGFYMCGDIVREVLQYGRWSETCARTRFSSVARPVGRSPGRSPGRLSGERGEMTEAREASSRARVRANEMAEIETTYQVIKYEVGTSVDVGARATEDGWLSAWMSGEMSGERMMLGWMKTTRGGRTRGWRD